MATDFDRGLLAGILIGEGHFGGDGRQPHITLRMHVRHAAIFRWLLRTFPGGKLYGPYHHGGRDYFQWMARGTFLRNELVPLLEHLLSPEIDAHSFTRFRAMAERYRVPLVDAPFPVAAPSTDSLHATASLERADDPDERGPGTDASPGRRRAPQSAASQLDALFDALRRDTN